MHDVNENRRWPFARGSGSTIALATGLLAAVLALARARSNTFTRLLSAVAAGIWLVILYFFRDPDRPLIDEPGLVVSAGDGEVVALVQERENDYLQQEAIRISVFLSLFDVHVQRIPTSGTIKLVQRRPGKFLQAFRPEASTVNEHVATVIETPYGPLLVKQIAGIMARRCVNDLQTGQRVQTGQRFGMIKFGSRVDLYLPPTADLLVTIGAKVAGGSTPVARLSHEDPR
jgi:phosphatidylserine decarboxylase